MPRSLLVLICLLLVTNLTAQHSPKREMRAVWIATVANIDWPSQSKLTTQIQKQEMIELLDLAKEYHLNTVVFQVRPATDAFYPSDMEPWSQWLNGRQGKAPEPYYDPLAFTIDECKKRGLDLHLWLNPYRAVTDTARASIAPNHPVHQHPEWFVTYGKARYFNPGLPETRNHVASVVADLLRRYDVNAIHFDDYFYPYRIAGQEFPDQSAFELYPRGFSPDKKDDWRRDNVDLIIQQLHDTIKAIKPQVEFGISPFGVWRNIDRDPAGSRTRAGQTNYDDLFANILKWQEAGWIDYITPQIYWHIGKEVADYAILADWWSKNALGCRLYMGQALYRIDKQSNDREWRSAKQITRQINLNRSYANIDGSMFFSARFLRRNPLKLKQTLKKKVYHYQALPPMVNRVTPMTPEAPQTPVIRQWGKMLQLSWSQGLNNRKYVIYKFKKGTNATIEDPEKIVLVTGHTSVTLALDRKNNPKKFSYYITALSPTNTESVSVPFLDETDNTL